jgi:hypothetical protein
MIFHRFLAMKAGGFLNMASQWRQTSHPTQVSDVMF